MHDRPGFENGYIPGRILGEAGSFFLTLSASSWSKVGWAAKAGKAVLYYDTAGNIVMTGDGVHGIVIGGEHNYENYVKAGGGVLFGVGPALAKLRALRKSGFTSSIAKTLDKVDDASAFKLGKHGDMPSPRPTGTESHHGVMSQWMKTHFKGYDPNRAPAILMPATDHHKTFGVYNKWRAEMKRAMGGTFDWSKVGEADMIKLSESMFDAAKVPSKIQKEYWEWYKLMVKELK